MPAIRKLSRQRFGMELRRGTFDIENVELTVGTMDGHREAESGIAPRRHRLQLRSGR